MISDKLQDFGLTTDLLIKRTADELGFVMSGKPISDSGTRSFHQILTYRAATFLWFHLTRLFVPGRSTNATSLIGTAPLMLPEEHTLTTHIEITTDEEDNVHIRGTGRSVQWIIELNPPDAQRLWAELDIALFPVGWQGRDTYNIG